MSRLANRQKQIPNGLQYYDPVLKWSPPRGASFQVICDGLLSARLANPGLSKANGLSTDANSIAEEVDAFNAHICEVNGWTDFVTGGSGGAAVPFPQRPQSHSPLQKLRNAAGGSEVLVEWIVSGAEAVPQEQANKRAETCAKCPLNGKGDWLARFTVPVSNAIRKELNRKREMKLETTFDAELGVCDACDCPMPLKVWMPFDKFFSKMPQGQKDALDKDCWIREVMPK